MNAILYLCGTDTHVYAGNRPGWKTQHYSNYVEIGFRHFPYRFFQTSGIELFRKKIVIFRPINLSDNFYS